MQRCVIVAMWVSLHLGGYVCIWLSLRALVCKCVCPHTLMSASVVIRGSHSAFVIVGPLITVWFPDHERGCVLQCVALIGAGCVCSCVCALVGVWLPLRVMSVNTCVCNGSRVGPQASDLGSAAFKPRKLEATLISLPRFLLCEGTMVSLPRLSEG